MRRIVTVTEQTAEMFNITTSKIAFEQMAALGYGIGNKYRNGKYIKVNVDLGEYILNGKSGGFYFDVFFDSGITRMSGGIPSTTYKGDGQYELAYTISDPNINPETGFNVLDTDTRSTWWDLAPPARVGDSISLLAVDGAGNVSTVPAVMTGWLDNTPPSWDGYDSNLEDFQWWGGEDLTGENGEPGIEEPEDNQFMKTKRRVEKRYKNISGISGSTGKGLKGLKSKAPGGKTQRHGR